MIYIKIAIGIFVFIEFLNIILLYFRPSAEFGNSVGVFNAFGEAQKNELMKPFVDYMVNWVAGTKLIFIALGIGILIHGDFDLLLFTAVALLLSILSFYWRLFPLIKKMDEDGKLSKNGYSTTLNFMILGFLIMFAVAIISVFSF